MLKPAFQFKKVKHSFRKAATEMPMEVMRVLIDDWPKNLKACVKSKDDHFE